MADDNDLLVEMLKQLREDLASASDALREDLAGEREAGRESRSRLHGRVDEVLDRLGKIDTSIAIAGQIDAQVRGELDALTKTVNEQLAPTVEQWSRLMKTGRRVSIVLATSGVLSVATIAAIIVFVGDAAINFFRALLRIS